MDKIIILDFGSQYTQLIARRIREMRVLAEIHPPDLSTLPLGTKGLILSGSPSSVEEKSFAFSADLLQPSLPILGICFGMQLMNTLHQGTVARFEKGEYGKQSISLLPDSPLFKGLAEEETVWMSHRESIHQIAPCYTPIAHSKEGIIAAFEHREHPHFGIQFHPEVTHTPSGNQMLKNFIQMCQCSQSWTLENYYKCIQEEIREKVKNGTIISLMSGGVDSTAATVLCMHALGPERVLPLHIDTGLMRENESASVKQLLEEQGMNHLTLIDASKEFLSAIQGMTDPEEKRHTIGDLFIKILNREMEKLNLDEEKTLICQGTLYTDLIESGKGCGKNAAVIKSHHNVNAPIVEKKRQQGLIIEPNAGLFKDEVRHLCEILNLPRKLVWRHPFPGPGLAIRILGEVTEDRLQALRLADQIFLEEIENAGLYDQIWQAFALFLPLKSVGVMGDGRFTGHVIALRAVTSCDGMTADFFSFPHEFLSRVSSRIVNEVSGISRVVYDITSKPPGTIEWE